MSQQINLFNPIFLKQKKYFSAVTMLQALGMILAGSVIVSSYAGYQAASLRREAENAAAQLSAAQAQLARVNATHVAKQKSQALEDAVQKTEADTKAMQQIFDILEKGEIGNTHGYADYMRAFARRTVGGVWLTGFNVSGAGDITLQGRALQPALVPIYLGRLKNEPVLQGKAFAALEIKTPPPEPAERTPDGKTKPPAVAGFVEFSLRSEAQGKQGAQPGAVK